jgi:hypothetical protein
MPTHQLRSDERRFVLMHRRTHSKAYQRGMGLLVVLGAIGFAFALFYLASFFV